MSVSDLDGTNGFRIDGETADSDTAFSIHTAGDINGDGIDDIIIGARLTGGAAGGATYVVFGTEAPFSAAMSLSGLNGSNGFQITGASGDWSGSAVSSAGDVNGDGYDDLLIGGYNSDRGEVNGGVSYVVFGKAGGFGTELMLADMDAADGFRIDGAIAEEKIGTSVSSAGDINGDGYDDLFVGAGVNGKSYIIFGGNFGTSTSHEGTAAADSLSGSAAAEQFIGGAGDDELSGGGGADVFYGAAGDDIITVSDLNFQRVDGGNGNDTLALDGSGMILDLSSVRGRIRDIESIDLTGSGDNELQLSALDILNLSGSSNTLIVDGDAGDSVSGLSAGGWTDAGSDGVYQTFTSGAAVLLVGVAMSTDSVA
jgi:hypothetical protein